MPLRDGRRVRRFRQGLEITGRIGGPAPSRLGYQYEKGYAFLGFVMIAMVGLWLLHERGAGSEPPHHGKPIRWYLERIHLPSELPDDGTNRRERDTAIREAASALREMGSSAVDWLAQRLERKETPGQRRYRALWEAMPAGMRRWIPTPHRPPGPSESILDRRVLGVLVQLGAAVVPVLTNYLDVSRYEQSTREDIYRELSFLPLQPSAAAALPMLEYNLSATNAFDQFAAAYAIAQIEPARTADAVAKLRAGLRSTHRVSAADYLGDLGSSAKEAELDLIAALDDPDPQFRERARIALQKVTGRPYPRR